MDIETFKEIARINGVKNIDKIEQQIIRNFMFACESYNISLQNETTFLQKD